MTDNSLRAAAQPVARLPGVRRVARVLALGRARDDLAAGLAAPVEGIKQTVSFVVKGHRLALAKVAATAYVGGMLEALFLVTVTRAAFAITDHHDRIGIVASWYLSMDQTLAAAVAMVLLRVVLAVYTNRQSVRLSTTAVASVRHRMARSFLGASWGTQQEQRSGSLQELMTGFSSQASAVMGDINSGLVAAASLIALVAMAVAVNPVGALILVASVGVLGLLLRPFRAIVRRRAEASASANLDFAVSVNEIADLGLELHVFQAQGAARERVGGYIERSRRAAGRLSFVSAMSTPIYTAFAYLTLVAALAVIASSNTGSFTSLGASMLVMLRSLSYGQAVQAAYMGVSGASPAIDELRRRLDLFDGARRIDGGQPLDHVGAITAEDVSFAYPGGSTVLHDLSFRIEPNEIVGIVGPSGSGKSTLVQLLLGLRDPGSGRILAGGRPIDAFDRADWARKVTFVPQAAHLIAGSVSENIRFFRDPVSAEDVERAARLAHLHDEIIGFPAAYDHQVGEHGGHLSGGQQQRLCIARALIGKPEVLILDEPTSALDVFSEHLIRATMLDLKQRMTVIVIAHRLSTLAVCDRIMVIQDGRLKGFDKPLELEQASPFYRDVLAASGLH